MNLSETRRLGTAAAASISMTALLLSTLGHSGEPSRPLKYEEPQTLTGRIYSRGAVRTNLLFNFRRQASRSEDRLDVLREYTYPDGRLAARERLVYAGDDLLSYALEESQTGGHGRAELRRDAKDPAKSRIWFEYAAERNARPKTDSEPLQKDVLTADMVAPFLVSHWKELMAGREVKCRYIFVPRLETIGFTFKRQSGGESEKSVLIQMEATSPVIRALVEPLRFQIERNPPYLVLEYSGRTTPKTLSRGKWKDLEAITVFDWK